MATLFIIIGTASALVLIVTGLLALQHWLGFTRSVRDLEGRLDYGRSPIGLALSLLVFALLIGGPAAAIRLAEESTGTLSFAAMWGLAYAVFFLVNLYDLVVLDYILVVRHRPSFITGLPNTPYYTTMTPHIQGFVRGAAIGLATSLLSAALAWFIL